MDPDNTHLFYSSLPVIDDFFNASDESNYHAIPSDWYLAITDIVKSTEVHNNQRYRNVNIVGVSPIVGILNKADRDSIPYVFAGDGCAFCIPPQLFEDAQEVLSASRQIAKQEYNLDLRAALIPVSYIQQQGHKVKVARYRASEYYIQAIFTGGGISFAEEILKKPGIEEYRITTSSNAEETDFSGLECRWQKVSQQNRKVITLLVKHNPQLKQPESIYRNVLQKMREIFGFDDETNPIDRSALKMNLSFSKLSGELKLRTFKAGWLPKIWYLLRAEFEILIGKLLMGIGYETSATNWSRYKDDMVQNSDHRKFDDMLRVVISGTERQRRRLKKFLQKQFKDKKLAYGMHVAEAALVTCMVFQYHGEHIHFVDGSGGGYSRASKELKERLQALKDK